MSRRWNSNEDVTLYNLVTQQKSWKDILKYFPGKTEREIRARYFHRYTNRLQKLWTPDEDRKLIEHYNKCGFQKWSHVAKQLTRSVRECRDRWINDIGPTMSDGALHSRLWTDQEDNLVLNLYRTLGQKWSAMALQMRNRTAEEIHYRWETRLKRRYKYRQSIQKPSLGIRVSVLRKGEKEWQQIPGANVKGENGENETIPLKNNSSSQFPRDANRSKMVLRHLQSSTVCKQEPSRNLKDAVGSPTEKNGFFDDLPNVTIPSDEIDDICKMEWDISSVLRLTPDKNHLLCVIQDPSKDKENQPPGTPNPLSLPPPKSRQTPVIKLEEECASPSISSDPPVPTIGRRKRSRKQMTSTPHLTACLSSPSPPAADQLTNQLAETYSATDSLARSSDSDDREAFIKRFKLEVERDFTELQLQGSSRDASFTNEFFSDDEKEVEAVHLHHDFKQYDLSTLVSPIKPVAGIDLSSNAVLNMASEVDDSLRSSSPILSDDRISCNDDHSTSGTDSQRTRFFFRHSRGSNRRGCLGLNERPHDRSSGVSRPDNGWRSSKSTESVDQAILEKYNPVRFAFRRVMQIGNDRGWRHVALGSSRVQAVMTNLAQSFLRLQHSA